MHTKKRNRLLHDRMRDLVFVSFNSKLRHKKQNKNRDPIEKEVNDVLEDDDNEFITGFESNANQGEDQEPNAQAVAQGASTSQAKAKRKRLVRPRKKKLRTLRSLMFDNSVQPAAASGSSSESEENQDANTSMHTESSDAASSEDD